MESASSSLVLTILLEHPIEIARSMEQKMLLITIFFIVRKIHYNLKTS